MPAPEETHTQVAPLQVEGTEASCQHLLHEICHPLQCQNLTCVLYPPCFCKLGVRRDGLSFTYGDIFNKGHRGDVDVWALKVIVGSDGSLEIPGKQKEGDYNLERRWLRSFPLGSTPHPEQFRVHLLCCLHLLRASINHPRMLQDNTTQNTAFYLPAAPSDTTSLLCLFPLELLELRSLEGPIPLSSWRSWAARSTR